jgi:hypothetical protein
MANEKKGGRNVRDGPVEFGTRYSEKGFGRLCHEEIL